MTTKFKLAVTPPGGVGQRTYTSSETIDARWSFDDGVEVRVRTLSPSYTYTERGRGYSNPVRATHPRVYVDAGKSFNALEDLSNRRRRPHHDWKPFVVEALDRIGITYERMFWSQTAGCSCGCSPGFVLRNADAPPMDVWVTLPGAPTVDESLPARDLTGVML